MLLILVCVHHLDRFLRDAPLRIFCGELNYIIAIHKQQLFGELSLEIDKDRAALKGDLSCMFDGARNTDER